MSKKLVYLGIAFLMLFSIAGLSACDLGFDLASYKTTAKAEITSHVQGLSQTDYAPANWTLVEQRADEGKTAVEAAASKPAVDTAKTEAITGIDNVPKEENNGAFYSLQEAFDKGLLTKADLQSIAYYHNDDSMPVYPEPLDADIAEAIKRDFVHNENCQDKGHDIEIIYYGTYNDSVAVLIYCQLSYAGILYNETVDDIFFYYGSPDKILIWKASQEEEKPVINGTFYSLQEAFDQGLLTKANLESIAYYHNDDSMPIYPEPLDAAIAEAIKRNFVHQENCQDKTHDIEIKYYGTYGGSVAVLIYCQLSYAGILYNETVDDIFFYYGSPDKILIWKEKTN